MNRTLMLALTLAVPLLAACPLLDSGDDPADASIQPDSNTPADTSTGPCTKNRDCYTRNGSPPVCDTATGQCIDSDWPLMMPCDTESDCRTYYITSLVYCSSAKLCAMPCPMEAGEDYATTCGYTGERTCGYDSICMCTSTKYCKEGEVCATVAKRCLPKCTSDLDCAPIEGTTCDLSSGQCVK